MRLFMIIDLYVGYKEACCYGVEKVENSTIIVRRVKYDIL